MPQGGSITLASMVPLLIISYRHGWKWGMFSAVIYGILKVMLSNNFAWLPAGNFLYFAGVALLDYIVAFGVLGLADLFRKPFKNKYAGYAVSCVLVMFLRFACHFVSGIVIWTVLFPPELLQYPWIFSLIYNGSYMLPNAIISVVVLVILARYVKFERTELA